MLNISGDVNKDRRYKNKIINELIENTLTIYIVENGEISLTITEDNIVSESMTLKQSICDGEKLRFGGCIASEFEVQLIDTEEMTFTSNLVGQKIWAVLSQEYPTGESLYPSMTILPSDKSFLGEIINNQKWPLFFGTVDSAKRSQDDKNIRNIVAYDPIAKLYEKNVSNSLYKAMKANKATITELLPLCLDSSQYAESDFEWYSPTQFRNYLWEDEKAKNSNSIKISKGELLSNICEVNGGFGYFRTISFSEPRGYLRLLSANDNIRGTETYEFYESLTLEEKYSKKYEGVLFPYGGNFADGYINGWENKTGLYDNGKLEAVDSDIDDSQNCYDISENILAWDYSADNDPAVNLRKINSFYYKMKTFNEEEFEYIPMTATLDGRLWVEVGDIVHIYVPETNVYGEYIDENGDVVENMESAKINIIKSRVFSRTLTGIKALTDTIEAKGEI